MVLSPWVGVAPVEVGRGGRSGAPRGLLSACGALDGSCSGRRLGAPVRRQVAWSWWVPAAGSASRIGERFEAREGGGEVGGPGPAGLKVLPAPVG
jgi:hypothetical protein